ncbi:hypothetical protein ACFVUY_19370 [Kitasatospora sp. NPDC058063]|uniref:hypothetical protein n=1 Tax=unclassified Kitasatospora TaxID=2633591 RepID=UPI0036DE1E5C
MPEAPTPAEAIPGGVAHPDTPHASEESKAPAPEGGEEGPAPKPVEPDYRALYEKIQAELDTARERGQEAGVEADELRAQVAQLQEQALRGRIAAEYALPPVLAALVQGSDEAAVRAHAEQLATVAVPKPVPAAGGLTPHSEPDLYKGLAKELRRRR